MTAPRLIKDLERLFIAQLPEKYGGDSLGIVQSMCERTARELIAKHLCKRVVRKVICDDGMLTISGYTITPAGAAAVCDWVAENCGNEEIAAIAQADAELLRKR